ncbi:hypothetical protein BDV18DRAFT_146714 [Aspergillus unguis]
MSTAIGKRKRARKACNPCHQRKRKCDAEFPCGTCTTYQYQCSYDDDELAANDQGPAAKQMVLGGPTSTAIADSQSRRGPSAVASAAASPSTTKSPGIFEEHKSRYTGASAAMAFPHILGLALGSDSPPKINSFAYNFGIRPEEASYAYGSLNKLISEENLTFYSNVYFSAMGEVGDFIDPRIYAQRCRDYYHGQGLDSTTVTFGAIAAGVAAFGSFLSPPANRYVRESDLLQYAKSILEDPASMRMPSVDQIIAWGMRVFYLRATTRPSTAWLASCTPMHLCEVVGLHEEENIQRIASVAGAASLGHDADRLRRIFWIAWAGHHMLSYEYDRSPVTFAAVTTQAILPVPGSVADQFVRIIQMMPSPNSPFQLDPAPKSTKHDLFERLKALSDLHFTHPFLVVTKADLAFCFYRRLYHLRTHLADEILQLIIDSGNDAVHAAEQLANHGSLLWNVIGSVFQYTCILLAIDTPASSAHVATAFKGLENLVRAADTGLTRQALSIARHLLSLNIAKKRKDLQQLEAVEASYSPLHTPPEPEPNADMPELVGWGIDWDQFLVEPYLSMFPDLQM